MAWRERSQERIFSSAFRCREGKEERVPEWIEIGEGRCCESRREIEWHGGGEVKKENFHQPTDAKVVILD